MGKLAEIIASGVAPGFSGSAKDPGCPQMAVPRALRAMEDACGSKAKEMISTRTQYSTKRLREIWIDGRKARKHKPKPE